MKYVILIVSFLLDGIISKYIPINGIFYPLFSLVSLLVAYPYFCDDKRNYYKCSFIIGLLYDLIYTDTMVFYAFLFLFMAFIIIKLSIILASNYFNMIIIALVSIVIFRSVSYIFIVITGNISFNYHIWIRGIYSSILINVIYTIILLFITNLISKIFNIKKNSH